MAKGKNLAQAQDDKLEKVIIKDRAHFQRIKAWMMSKGENFIYTSSGSINTIICDGRELMCVDLKESGGRGHHLNRRFRKDVDSWLAAHGGQIHPYPGDYKEQLFHLAAIEKHIGRETVAVDINDCYWKTAFQLGYITEETYVVGLKKKEWKTGRNACIGSLVKNKIVVPYYGGKPQYKLRESIKGPIEYQYVRNHIIGHVYKLFYRLYQELGDHYCMFLTDCVFADCKAAKRLHDYFMDNGYRTKKHPVEFTGLNRSLRKVSWFDFEAKRMDSAGQMVGLGVNKYYLYANHQIVDGLLEPTGSIANHIS